MDIIKEEIESAVDYAMIGALESIIDGYRDKGQSAVSLDELEHIVSEFRRKKNRSADIDGGGFLND